MVALIATFSRPLAGVTAVTDGAASLPGIGVSEKSSTARPSSLLGTLTSDQRIQKLALLAMLRLSIAAEIAFGSRRCPVLGAGGNG